MGPAGTHAGHGCVVERLAGGRRFELADAPNPFYELGLDVLRPAAQMGELEMGMAIDEPRRELRIGKMERLHAARGWDGAVWTDRGDATVCINENGAILN